MITLPPFDKIGVTPTPPFVNASPSAGITGSIINALIFNALQSEMQNAISGTGQSPTDSDYTQLLQAISFGGIFVGNFGGSSDALTAALPNNIVIPALKAGMRVSGFVTAANLTTSPTLAVAGFTTGSAAAPIKRRGGASPAAGDLMVALTTFRFDGTNWRVDGLTLSDISAYVPSAASQALYTLPANQNISTYTDTTAGLTGTDPAFAASAAGVVTINTSGLYAISAALSINGQSSVNPLTVGGVTTTLHAGGVAFSSAGSETWNYGQAGTSSQSVAATRYLAAGSQVFVSGDIQIFDSDATPCFTTGYLNICRIA